MTSSLEARPGVCSSTLPCARYIGVFESYIGRRITGLATRGRGSDPVSQVMEGSTTDIVMAACFGSKSPFISIFCFNPKR